LNNCLIALLLLGQFDALDTAARYRRQLAIVPSEKQSVTQLEKEVIGKTSYLALISGLSLTNQHTSVVYVVLSAVGVMWAGRGVWTTPGMICVKALSSYSLCALCGLSPYLYLPLAASSKVSLFSVRRACSFIAYSKITTHTYICI
jgi:hypothetical protein